MEVCERDSESKRHRCGSGDGRESAVKAKGVLTAVVAVALVVMEGDGVGDREEWRSSSDGSLEKAYFPP